MAGAVCIGRREGRVEFNEKLRELRRRAGFTQEELAAALNVSRAAVAKWEQGRGYPAIDSLRDIARYFSVSLDDLLSSENLLAIAKVEARRASDRSLVRAFGLLDCAALLLAVLPVFNVGEAGAVSTVPLFSVLAHKPVLFAVCAVGVATSVLLGALTLGLGRRGVDFPDARVVSLVVTSLCALLFVACRQTYAASLALTFLAIKAFMLVGASRHES